MHAEHVEVAPEFVEGSSRQARRQGDDEYSEEGEGEQTIGLDDTDFYTGLARGDPLADSDDDDAGSDGDGDEEDEDMFNMQ